MLITIYFVTPENDVAKCIIPKEHVDFFSSMGCLMTEAEAKAEASGETLIPDPTETEVTVGPPEIELPETLDLNPDKGFGEPGTLDFHAHNILGASSKKEVVDYVKEATSHDMSSEGSLNEVKTRAVNFIEGWLTNG